MKTPSISIHASDAEINAAVAEHVVKLTPSPTNPGLFRTSSWGGGYTDEQPPAYATSLDTAYLLLDALKARGLWVEIKDHTNGCGCGVRDWLVIITNYNPDDEFWVAEPDAHLIYREGVAPTLAKAACFALLKAAGVEVVES